MSEAEQQQDDDRNDDVIVREALMRLIRIYGIEAVVYAVEELDPMLTDQGIVR